MKGLLIKDFCFAKEQRRMLVILAIIFAAFIFSQGKESAAFVISYMTLVGGMLTITSISYDEYDGSMAFLLTFPITRKQYVIEKYIFGFLCGGICCIISTAIYMLMDIQGSREILVVAAVLLMVLTFFLMIMLPIQLKFGGDKGRIALIGIFAAFMLAIYGVKHVGEKVYQIDFDTMKNLMIEKLSALSPWTIGVILAVIWVGALVVSLAVSVKIVEQKEY